MEGALALQELKRCLCILFSKEGDVDAGLLQCQAKQLPLARTVLDQENGGMRHHYGERDQQGLCLVIMRYMENLKYL